MVATMVASRATAVAAWVARKTMAGTGVASSVRSMAHLQQQRAHLSFLTQDQATFFKDKGYLVIPDFFDKADCQAMREACQGIVQQYDPAKEKLSTFSTVEQNANDYFLESGDKIRYFFEEGAVDKEGNIVADIDRAFNKIGHGLHFLSPVFKKYTFDPRIKQIARDVGLVEPAVPQSMYIFKQPGIGGEVVPHQDSTFLYTDPLSTTGFWIPLQDCTTENGCLEMIPGSHKEGVHNNRRMTRSNESDNGVTFTAPPREYKDEDFIPAETPAGALVLIHGSVVHRSSANRSDKSRHAYTFHAIETKGTAYPADNWLQTPTPFPRL